MKDFPGNKAGSRGFSLLELSLIILILGLLTPLVWRFIAAQTAQKSERANYSLLEQADWALTGYAMANARLPCPDAGHDGEEDCAGMAETGFLPYRTLGLADARAGWVRYGVLRRMDAVTDPEAVADDPVPALPRTADLAAATIDRFYPFFAFLGDGDPLDGIGNLPNLNTDNGPSPVPDSDNKMPASANVPLGNVNTLDFCAMLRIADDPPPAAAGGHLNVGGWQMAYALALPGDLPGNADFDPPSAPQTWQNNASSRAVSLATLWQRLECAEATASIGHAHPNAATAGVMLYRGLFDYEQVQQQAVELANVGILIATSQVVSATAAVIDATAAALHAAGDAAKSFGLLSVTSIGAAVLMAGAAAVQVPLAAASLYSAVEARNKTEQRFVFLKGLRGTARTLAQQILNDARAADARGLYQEQP